MKKNDFLSNVNPIHRRALLERLSLLLTSSILPSGVAGTLINSLSEKAYAQGTDLGTGPKYFLEVNFRDQWDFGGVFVPPSIAKAYSSLPKDGDNGIAFFGAPTQVGGVYLTKDGMALKDHLDSIAIIETGDCAVGSIHGHEAGNNMRSPGRSYNGGAGRFDMASIDVRPGGRTGGNEIIFSSTPTPAILHNYHSKGSNAALLNGALIRNTVRADVHTFYHFEAALKNAQVDRFFNRTELLKFFAAKSTAPQTDVLSLYRKDVVGLVKQLDNNFFKKLPVAKSSSDGHLTALEKAAIKQQTGLSNGLQHSADEMSAWAGGIPEQVDCPDDSADSCVAHNGAMNIGETFGYIAKLFQSGLMRTAAIDFDFHDIHTARTPSVLETQGKQTAIPLARLIKALKDAGIYDQTVIAMYTLDGSRSPRRNSTGEGSKNAVILAGGGIKGGYYGDVSIKGDDVFYHRPDDNGIAVTSGAKDKDKRVAGADIYATVAKAAGIPDELVKSFPDAKNGKVLKYLFKA